MRSRAWIVCLLLLGLVSWAAAALPDLVVSSVGIQPSTPQAGDVIQITAVVSNYGSSAVEGPFFVRFLIDGREISLRPVTTGIPVGGSRSVSTEWTAVAGPHSVMVEADPPVGRIEESNEENNSAPRTFTAMLSAEAESAIRALKVVVAPFEDRTSSGFLHVGEGVADMLTERLVGVGARVLERSELESILQEHSLDPAQTADVALAGRQLGADIVILGSVSNLSVVDSTLQLGFLSVSGAEADVQLSAQLVNVYTAQIIDTASGEGHDDGTTGFSVDLGGFLSLLESPAPDVCSGGLQTARSWYNVGESVPIAYNNSDASKWLSVEITNGVGSFVKWLGWQYVATGDCGVWNWDQLNTSGIQLGSGIYTAKVWDGISYIAQLSFQIRPGISLSVPPVTEITVGSAEFDETVVGSALSLAVDDLTAGLLSSLVGASSSLTEERTVMGFAEPEGHTTEGQIAAVLADGRVAINIGASSGVAVGDVLEVLEVANVVVDPESLKVLSYDSLGIKGEIVITEVRERASFGVPTTEFQPVIGDIARNPEP